MERTTARHHILVLEDDTSIAELLTLILSDEGYRVTCCDSVRDARRVCDQSTPDVIIADLLLPDGLGSDLVRDVCQEQNGNGPASIVMSAVPQGQRYADAAGAQRCITKPFDLSELLDVISGFTETGARELQPQ